MRSRAACLAASAEEVRGIWQTRGKYSTVSEMRVAAVAVTKFL
jgi:hypothetical protein